MAKQLNLSVTRGETLQSGKIFTVIEPLPLNITYKELMEGIEDGTYTLESLMDHTFTGEIRNRANATLRGTLVCTVEDDQLSFSLASTVTKTWPNEATTFKYDLFSTNTITGVVKKVVYGNIDVIPAITNEDI